jgi:hypothetical protein
MRFQATIPFFTRYTSLVIKHKWSPKIKNFFLALF